MKTLQDLLADIGAKDRADANRYESLGEYSCMACGATGPDKRSLVVDCFYAIDEVIPELISLRHVEGRLGGHGYYARICKTCRGRFLAAMKAWWTECVSFRESAKDSDGEIEVDDPERNIPVRINGAVVMMTCAEYDAHTYGAK